MTKKIKQTQPYIPRKPEKHAKWLAEPVAVIQRPLRFIRERLTEIRVNQETGKKETLISPLYFMAKDFADAGDGEAVKYMARITAREGTAA